MRVTEASMRALELVETTGFSRPGVKDEAVRCALEDRDEMGAVWASARMADVCLWDEEGDTAVYTLIALLYLVRLRERGESLPAIGHLDCLLDFGRDLEPASFDGIDEEQDIRGPLDQLWSQYCGRRGLRVTELGGEGNKVMPRRPLPPLNPPEHPLCLDYRGQSSAGGQEESRLALEHVETEVLDVKPAVDEVPKLYDLVQKAVLSDFFRDLPSRLKGDAKSKLVDYLSQNPDSDPTCDQLLPAICALYKGPFKVDQVEEEEPEEDYVPPLTVGEAVKILKAIGSGSPLFACLVLERPPMSVMPHKLALNNCAEHARLWLCRIPLRVYYDLELTYAELCTQEARGLEQAILEHRFRLERRPSPVEKGLRQRTLKVTWNASLTMDEYVRILEPEDFDLVKRKGAGSKLMMGIKNLGYPLAVGAADVTQFYIPVFSILNKFVPVLKYEDRAKLDWLFRQGRPELDWVFQPGRPTEDEMKELFQFDEKVDEKDEDEEVGKKKPAASSCTLL